MNVTIWHNPRCSKSRQALQLLNEQGVSATVVEYLKSPPTTEELGQVLDMLGLEPRDLMRTREVVYREQGLADISDREALIAAMVRTPILIERPVVIHGSRAVIGRPPEAVLELVRG